jgi:hypothetical protein
MKYASGYLQQKLDINFDAVKYRSKFRAFASHAHLTLPGELVGLRQKLNPNVAQTSASWLK